VGAHRPTESDAKDRDAHATPSRRAARRRGDAALSGAAPAAAAGVPPASQCPGYIAQAVCSENGVPVGSELFDPYGALKLPGRAVRANVAARVGV
jgi:hypothetical protein